MTHWEKDIDEIKTALTMDEAHRLILADLPMILTPRMFFVNIQKKVEELSGIDTGRRVYYQAAFESAYRYTENSRRVYGITGSDLLQQYLDSLSARGWGRFEILELAEEMGVGRVRLTNSVIAEEFGNVGRSVCHAVAGALAGSIEYLARNHRPEARVRGTEPLCMSKGDPCCEFVVAPEPTGQAEP
ncbi:MAG: 4-vinyl reductase [Deltaproteobacteria bacterium]|nr:4-vinyl reductase [Deltaproteobacteria bacterium]MBW2121687.1 4-vinyl reductase [Deltaproteobacteria bacterium]